MYTTKAALFTLALTLVACGDERAVSDVGQPCTLQIAPPPQGVVIHTAHTACQSSLCIQYSVFNSNAEARCTATCDSAADCPASAGGCSAGFACVIGQTIDGPLSCKKLCVCRTDVSLPAGVDPQVANCAR